MNPKPDSLVGRLNSTVKTPSKEYTAVRYTAVNTAIASPGTALNNRLSDILTMIIGGDHAGAAAAVAQLQYQATHCVWNDDGTLNC